MGFTEKRFNIERFNRLPEDALAEIVEASWKHWRELGVCDDETPGAWREYLRFEDRTAPRLHFGVTWNSRVVAMASVVEMDYPPVEDFTPWMANLFVLPEFRSKGLPELLRGQRAMALKQLGYSEVYIIAKSDTESLHSMAGFVMIDEKRKIMKRNLRT